MACHYNSDLAFGPRVDTACRPFDFTLRFEDCIFGILPSATFLILGVIQLAILRRRPYVSSQSPPATRWWLLGSKLTLLCGLTALQLAIVILRARRAALRTSTSLAADVLSLAATLEAVVLLLVADRKSIRPSTVLSLYLSAAAVLQIPRIRTLWLLEPGSTVAAVFAATLAITTAAVLLESVRNREQDGSAKVTKAPEQYSGFWNRTCFVWLAATFRAGYTKIIRLEDLPPLDSRVKSREVGAQLEATWSIYDRRARHSLLRACFRAYLFSFLSPVVPQLCVAAFTFSNPFLINTTVAYVGQDHADANYGKGLIGAWAFVYIGIAVSRSVYGYQYSRYLTRLRAGLVSLIYRHSLEIRAAEHGEITAVALMGTDVERIHSGLRMFHEVWSSLLHVVIASWLLERQLSLAFLAPIILVLVFIVITSRLSLSSKAAQKKWIEKIQERLRATSSMLGDMKAVKMLNLTQVMSKVIAGVRKDEIDTSTKFRNLLTANLLLSLAPINLAPVVTFGVYTILAVYWKDESLLAAQAFTSVTLISMLTTPVISFIQGLPQIVECIASFDRIQEYCNYSNETDNLRNEIQSGTSTSSVTARSDEKSSDATKSTLISFNGQSFSWTKSTPVVLKHLEVHIHRNNVTAIIGSVGSGKTAFLNALLGELAPAPVVAHAPSVVIQEPIGFCSQQAWLENTTVRDNIIGPLPYDRNWYETVKWTCNLDPDLDQLEKRDKTQVGSKGLNLSGGQKHRIALARAIYAKTPIVFLDDVFSGMDANTADRISKRLFGKVGLFRRHGTTVVLTTHNGKIMALADQIHVLEDGMVVESGSPATLAQHCRFATKLGLCPVEEQDITERPFEPPTKTLVETEDHTETSGTLKDQKEDLRRKNGDFSVYKYYLRSAGYVTVGLFCFTMIVWQACTNLSTVWIKWWSEANAAHPNEDLGMYMGIYVMLGVIGCIGLCTTGWLAFVPLISQSALKLHSDVLETTLRAPFRFFATTDNGELLNRFSQDMELIDMELPGVFTNYTSSVMECLASVIIIAVFSQYLGITIPFIALALYFLQKFYLHTSRQVRLLGIEARAPLYSHFTETEAGAVTIRAFRWRGKHRERNNDFIDLSQKPVYLQSCIQHWLGFVLEFMTAILAVILVTTIITWKDKFSQGSVGVSLVTVVTFGFTLTRVVETWTGLESSIGAVKRVKDFITETESEERRDGTGDAKKLSDLMSAKGEQASTVEFAGIVASYRPDLEPALKGVSMQVRSGQHVAICGRSGSGKSSLILCLLQMMSVTQGQVSVDGIDLATLTCEEARSLINVVPQDAFLLPGTVRFNIDPQGAASDKDIIHALERLKLWLIVRDQGGLDQNMDVDAWSAGQKQLLCFARAMVRKGKILVLDEATSSVDEETEAVMQDVLETEMRGCTVLAVMHRLGHVTKYDRVVLMDAGKLVAFGQPHELIARETGFAQLYRSGTS